MKITINNQDYEFKFRFKELTELTKQTGKELSDLEEVAKDITKTSIIFSIGCKISLEQAENILDEGTFNDVTIVINAFSSEVVKYLNPNSPSQTV